MRAFITTVVSLLASLVLASPQLETETTLLARQAIPNPKALDVFQVYEPVLTPTGTSNQYGCVFTQVLMEHDFANSYGAPFIGQYTPPPCSFNRVTINFTTTIAGIQYDRLALMYLGDVEVFRTSTAEPTQNGIIWTYIKEMQQFDALWKVPQKLIFDLPNNVFGPYTGVENCTLTATFFTVPNSPPVADTILPITSLNSKNNAGSVFTVPGNNASVSYTLPKNVKRAVVTLQACGQSTEEFWYTNALNSVVNTFPNTVGTLYGDSPFREVQLLIDGQLAGVSWPFPIIFTGGIVFEWWSPIVGIDAFDLRQHEIDITPFLPLLLDGKPHTFEIRVISLNDDGHGGVTILETPGSYWLVTGTIFLFLDTPNSVTRGSTPRMSTPAPKFSASSSTTQVAGQNQTLQYSVSASRQLSISSTIFTSSGPQLVSWSQNLKYTSYNDLTDQGFTQFTQQNTIGTDVAPGAPYSNSYSYPIAVNATFAEPPDGSLYLAGTISRGLNYGVTGASVTPNGVQTFSGTSPFLPSYLTLPFSPAVFQGSMINTTQNAVAAIYETASGVGDYFEGTTSQDFTFTGLGVGNGENAELYSRSVSATNGSVTRDTSTFRGGNVPTPFTLGANAPVSQRLTGGVLKALASGPGGGFRKLLGRG